MINIRKNLLLFIAISFSLLLVTTQLAGAISLRQRQLIRSGATYYNSDEIQCAPAPATRNAASVTPGSSVYVLGDSITRQSTDEINTALTTAGFAVAGINADGGRAITSDTFPEESGPSPTGIEAVGDDAEIIQAADVVIIALGTNSGNEDLTVEIPNLIAAVRGTGFSGFIYWVNTFYTYGDSATTRNATITERSTGSYNVIDAFNANIELSEDQTHPTAAGEVQFADTMVGALQQVPSVAAGGGTSAAAPSTDCVCSATGGGGTLGDTSPLLGLTFPDFDNEALIVDGIERFIAETYSSSSWIGLGQWIMDESRANNVNPLVIVSTGYVESGYGNSRIGRELNNYYGVKSSNDGYRRFNSPQDGILYLIEGIPGFLDGSRASGLYSEVTNLYEYSSVHQTGQIVYPGEPFDPEDRDEMPGNTADLWDPAMRVYVSWDEEANLRPEVNPTYRGGVYNPLEYYSGNITAINAITGSSFADTPGEAGQNNTCAAGTSGAFGWDLPGEGDNPMVYYSQRSSGDDPAVEGYFGSEPYGPGNISFCGCGPTSWAMIVSTLTTNTVTPPEVATWAHNSGYQQESDGECGGSEWWWADNPTESFQRWGVVAEAITIDQAQAALRNNALIIVSVDEGVFTTGGHLLVMRGFTAEGRYLFADPNDYNDDREVAQAAFGGQSKSRVALDPEQFMGAVKGMWSVTAR